MAQISTNPPRPGPYKNFKFRIKLDGTYVAGVNKISALMETTEMANYREDTDRAAVQLFPGSGSCNAILLEQGITEDSNFQEWLNEALHFGSADSVEDASMDFRKDVVIEVYNEAGQFTLAYRFFRCWVSEYQALPELNAGPIAVAIQMIRLHHEGWDRIHAVG